MTTDSSPRRRRLLFFIYVMVGFVAMVLFAVGMATHVWGAKRVAESLERATPWLFAWRVTFGVVLVATWPRLVHTFRRWLPDIDVVALQQARWRLAVWLIAIELILVQGIPGRILAGLVQ